ncbi:TetR/AcrR family transcriptional regulator [Spirulina sp. 06S082]|uniref:TetR/AcrR family transcriptional regulator n=1 Tax=Spirulina sp. 06S082 TaxID=3110248 RepID=UPI002B21BBE8|nr:TetR/AcrR family transcriptional regulator [Spirulina sp. 06S082]MEA5468956.1 TetR/AcrR family transcriptional regulator [Spirulina sp. 06S082]
MPKIVDKEKKRHEIVEASVQVFKCRGYQGTRIIDIAKEAGIGKGTVYEYFNSKDEIILSVFDELFLDYEQLLYTRANSDRPPIEELLSSVASAFEDLDNCSELIPVYFELWSSRQLCESLGLQSRMGQWFERLSAAYTKLIEKGQRSQEISREIEARAFARTLVSAIDGIILHYCLFKPDKVFFAKQKQELERTLRRSLLP